MKFSAIVVAALAAVAKANVAFTNSVFDVEAGKPFNLTWAGNVGPVTITLKNGPQTNLKDVEVIDASDAGSYFVWTPPATLPSDTYAFQIEDSTGVPNYSVQFTFQGSASASVSTTTTSTASVSSSISTTVSSTTTTTSSSSSNSSTASTTSSKSSTTHSSTSSATTKASATATPANTNDGLRQKSPLALVLVTVAALLYFN